MGDWGLGLYSRQGRQAVCRNRAKLLSSGAIGGNECPSIHARGRVETIRVQSCRLVGGNWVSNRGRQGVRDQAIGLSGVVYVPVGLSDEDAELVKKGSNYHRLDLIAFLQTRAGSVGGSRSLASHIAIV